ncbi:hypothetical protein PAXRUDRAFT_615252 [Paxillus rubicundulus Ve08.2h10]|uniref:Uncharacterized protein n=1 Tax=Paxillus rubicundulus Ve08.2h10 TaxID=930991 RepID=A0A0D0E3R8_9AGAM|nr:hypothetical protein PAXRUDRAFT_615252 [Paxillus rubicundulus Ve08.2h10]
MTTRSNAIFSSPQLSREDKCGVGSDSPFRLALKSGCRKHSLRHATCVKLTILFPCLHSLSFSIVFQKFEHTHTTSIYSL